MASNGGPSVLGSRRLPRTALAKMSDFSYLAEPKTVKNRWHLDVRVGEANVGAEAARLTERGATFLHKASQGSHWWITMADPEGNEFCVS
ncbi:MAG TPA: VOC family protein [Streptosporangiaceae bacterium]|nr:VOC family protein [Streptosporangiaceae bacterium]